jgi:hypothetical protein
MRATRWIIVSLALGIFSVADAQDGQPVCPLSESQQTKAVEAFAKLLPIFGEPRCFNCHGGVSPFNKGRGTHPEFGFKVVCKDGSLGPCDRGSPENFEATFGECQSCHSEITGGEPPRWRLAPAPAMQWNLTGTSKEKPGIELCRQQKHLFAGDGPRFIRHMRNDDGGVQFIQAAYAGRAPAAAPATGIGKIHELEQQALVAAALHATTTEDSARDTQRLKAAAAPATPLRKSS